MLKGKKSRIIMAIITLVLGLRVTVFANGAAEMTRATSVVPIIMPILLLIALFRFALAYIPANIARKKGYGFMGFYILGIFLFFVALILSLCLSDKKQQIAEIKQSFNSEKLTSSVADELKKYSELLKNGDISQEEYDDIKKKLI